jgi:hypothetical protein
LLVQQRRQQITFCLGRQIGQLFWRYAHV